MRAVLLGFCEPLSCHTHSTGLGSMFAQLACSIALRPWRLCPSIFSIRLCLLLLAWLSMAVSWSKYIGMD